MHVPLLLEAKSSAAYSSLLNAAPSYTDWICCFCNRRVSDLLYVFQFIEDYPMYTLTVPLTEESVRHNNKVVSEHLKLPVGKGLNKDINYHELADLLECTAEPQHPSEPCLW